MKLFSMTSLDDELLARMLQEEERLHYGMNQAVLKELTPFELVRIVVVLMECDA